MNLTKLFISHGFSNIESLEFVSHFKKEKVLKGENLLSEGNRSKKVFFVESGILRLYYTRDLKEITNAFLQENSFCLALDSAFHNQNSRYGLDSLETSILYTIQYNEIEKMLDIHPKLYKLVIFVLLDVIKHDSDRFYSMQFQSAKERYMDFEKHHKQLILRVSLGKIASYLGITQQTLSKLRAKH